MNDTGKGILTMICGTIISIVPSIPEEPLPVIEEQIFILIGIIVFLIGLWSLRKIKIFYEEKL